MAVPVHSAIPWNISAYNVLALLNGASIVDYVSSRKLGPPINYGWQLIHVCVFLFQTWAKCNYNNNELIVAFSVNKWNRIDSDITL
jgi:hypothetical protein